MTALPSLLTAARNPSLPLDAFQRCLATSDLGELDEQGDNAMMKVAAHGPVERLPLMLQHFDLNATNVDEQTPLMVAALWNNAPMVQALLDAGAMPNLKTSMGACALSFAAADAGPEVVERLLPLTSPELVEDALRAAIDTTRLVNVYTIGRTLPSELVHGALENAGFARTAPEIQALLNELALRDVARERAVLNDVLQHVPTEREPGPRSRL